MLNKTDYKWIGMSSLAASLLFAGFESQATVGDVFMVDKLYYKVLTETGSAGTVEVVKDNDSWDYYLSGNLDIPASVKHGTITYSVVSIGDEVFQSTSVTGVTIPASVTRIGDYAFYNCKSLTGIMIPNNVISLGKGVFTYCTSLTSVTLGTGLTKLEDGVFGACSSLTGIVIPNNIKQIGDSAFSGCSKMTSLTLGSGVTSIEDNAFSICSKLAGVTFPNSLERIGGYAFGSCTALTSVTLPNSVKYIGESAFADCTALSSAVIPDNVDYIGMGAFENCNLLPSILFSTGKKILVQYDPDLPDSSYTIPGTVAYIAGGAFAESELTSITIPGSVTKIGDYAFGWCEYLESITIPNSVTTIGDYAFDGCKSLTSIDIPASVTSIGNGPFIYCRQLSTLTVNPSNPAYASVDNVLFNKAITTLIQYPRGRPGSDYTVPASVTVIAPDAFTQCLKLENVVLGNRVTTISEYAFYECEYLEKITIPDSVTFIGNNAFQNAGLLSVTLPEGVTEIGDEAFDYCYDMRTVTLGSKVTSIGNYAFSRCSSLTGITLPGSLTTIGNYAFKGCRMMESITIPDSVTTMGAGIFKECAGLLNITLPNKLTTIKANMFSGCVNLTSIVIPDSVTVIESYAFQNCERMKEVTFPPNLESISYGAFIGCRYLTKVTLPASLKSINYSVFKDCVRLTEVYYEGDNPSAGLNLYENTPDDLLSYYPTGNATWLERIENGKWRDRGVATWDPEPRPPGPTGDFTYTYEDGVLTLYFTGTLCQSVDAVHWTELPSAASPYRVALKDKKSFFCAKSGSTPPASKDITIPLASGVDLTLIWIEPGTFMMGSPENEFGRFTDEDLHQVTLTKGYWLGKYEVTQAQYEAVLGASANYSKFKDPSRPVECVFWSEATNFCAKLTEIERAAGRLPEGYEYSLPTEAQWEYACRAGTTTGLYSGKECTSTRGVCPNVDEIAWYDQNSGSTTHLPGQKQPNAWGFYDMAGNVAEWCQDWMGAYPTQAQVDPTGPETGTGRVLRGGDWNNYAQFCRSAARHSNPPNSWITGSIGFRVALVASTSQLSDEPVPGSSAIISLPNNVDLDMIWIDPGTFTMGSPTDELGRESDETQHKVTLTKGYWLGKYEVIQAQYEAVMGTNPSTYKGTDLPVETVSWYDAKEFCAKLTEIEKAAGRLPEGYEYTLPTEAQWEYACRAGTTTSLNSGKNLTNVAECPNMDEVGWYWYNAGIESYYQGLICTHPVGQKQSNGWGLYDMHGSVGEWCLDCYGDYPASAVSDPIGADTSAYRVCRGGSWGNYAWNCRSADRNSHSRDVGSSQVGFRLALAPVK